LRKKHGPPTRSSGATQIEAGNIRAKALVSMDSTGDSRAFSPRLPVVVNHRMQPAELRFRVID